MKLLLDAHTFLWFVWDDAQLSANAKALIVDAANQKFISPATYWEIAIKVSIGKLDLGEPYRAFMHRGIARNNFDILPLSVDHAAAVSVLPLHHPDPFDRMLIDIKVGVNRIGLEGSNLRVVILRARLPLYNSAARALNCRGRGVCGTCAVRVEGAVSEPTAAELTRLKLPPHDEHSGLRLACQCVILGDVTVTKLSGFFGSNEDPTQRAWPRI